MRHRWTKKIGFYQCLNCTCSKQKYYGLLLYFIEGIKDPFIKAPPCQKTHNHDKPTKKKINSNDESK